MNHLENVDITYHLQNQKDEHHLLTKSRLSEMEQDVSIN